MTSRAGPSPGPGDGGDRVAGAVPELPPDTAEELRESAEDLYENAPCGYLSTLMDGTIVKVNATLLDWLGRTREELVGRRSFPDLLTVGGRLYHETHFAPLLHMQGHLGGIALEMRTADGCRCWSPPGSGTPPTAAPC
ncbi:hypothetical protein GCM10010420_06690 [Streptomyces glaucosporus]|uniref:PAS domain-containing protein n=1 Tax=Streptomyces glaucosporus TaxID=284044 RepID=A0ABP5URY5_9ACTN